MRMESENIIEEIKDASWLKLTATVLSIVFACGIVYKMISDNTRVIQLHDTKIVEIEKWISAQTENQRNIEKTLTRIENNISAIPDIRAKVDYLIDTTREREKGK